MAKRPPEWYAPGELQRTRQNIGDLSSNEARVLSSALGGDIGVERTEANVQKKYEKLEQLNRRKSDKILKSKRGGSPDDDPSGIAGRVKEVLPGGGANYFNRVRMNFLAARAEYRIKTHRGALSSLFSFIVKDRDFINPRFITEGDAIFFAPTDKLVRSVRVLLSINQRYPANRIRNPFFVQILSIIKDWDIEGIHQELIHLQTAPRQLTFRYCSSLARKLFRPMIQLLDLAEGQFIKAALKRVYDLNLLSLTGRRPDIDHAKRHYATAAIELDYVLGVLKYQCYPLLMKLACNQFSDYQSFYYSQRAEVLEYLGLQPADILATPKGASEDFFNEPEKPDPEETPRKTKIHELPNLQRGFEILDWMFPKAGWPDIEAFPDMYSYFSTLFIFPRGFELVPPQDPLHQIIILTSILQELFYGYRTVEFDDIPKGDGKYIQIGRIIHGSIDKWRQFIDELIAQHYLSTLYEYCREIESNPRFRKTLFGAKQRDYLAWLKKLHILPHLVIGRPKPKEMYFSTPKLHELVAELCDILSLVARDLTEPGSAKPKTVKNPAAGFAFEIESPVSRRFKEVLRLYHEDTTNANLLLFSYAILQILNVLLNDKDSYFYPYPNEDLYRRESEDSSIPMYTIPALDPTRFFREADSAIALANQPPEQKPQNKKDTLTNLYNMQAVRDQLSVEIGRFHQDKIPFVLMSVTVKDFKTFCSKNSEHAGIKVLKSVASLIGSSIREFKDIPSRVEGDLFFLLLPGAIKEEAVNLGVRLIVKTKELETPGIHIAIGIIQFVRTWGKEKLIRVARQAAEYASAMDEPSLCIYDGKLNKFLSLQELRDR